MRAIVCLILFTVSVGVQGQNDKLVKQKDAACQQLIKVYDDCPLFHRVSGGEDIVTNCAEKNDYPTYLQARLTLEGVAGKSLKMVVLGPGSSQIESQSLQDGQQLLQWFAPNGKSNPVGFPWLLTRAIWIEGEGAESLQSVYLSIGSNIELSTWVNQEGKKYAVLSRFKTLRESSMCRVEESQIREILDQFD